jgi:electron transport complex protein RnfD
MAENQESSQTVYRVSAAPHIHKKNDIPLIMWTVVICLLPAGAVGIYAHGLKALWVILLSVFTAVATEYTCQKMRGVKVTIHDGSAVVTGLLFAYVSSCENYWYVVVIGSIFSIAIVKQAFGGLGLNIWNPALAARAFVLSAFSVVMTAAWPPSESITTISGQKLPISGATPLRCIKDTTKKAKEMIGKAPKEELATLGKTSQETWQNIKKQHTTHYLDLFAGTVSGSIGETSALLLLLGGIVLIWRDIVKWYLPFSILATTALLAWMLPVKVGWYDPATGKSGVDLVWFAGDPLFHILAGGCVLGAFFMATDMVTSPMTGKGQIIFGICIGILTMIIRLYGGYPEGVSYAILLMNTLVPIIDRYTKPKVFGAKS